MVVWFKADEKINALEFSEDGFLGIAPKYGCVYILKPNGELESSKCFNKNIFDVSYCCRCFTFSIDVIAWENVFTHCIGSRGWSGVHVDSSYYYFVTRLEYDIIVSNIRVARYDGNYKVWLTNPSEIYSPGKPVPYDRYVYVPSSCGISILDISRGKYIKCISTTDPLSGAYARRCNNFIVFGNRYNIVLFDVTDPLNPKRLWSYKEISTSCNSQWCRGAKGGVAFSSDCEYVIGTNYEDRKIHIFRTKDGTQIFTTTFDDFPSAADWWNDRIAIGFASGEVRMYSVRQLFGHLGIYDI